MENHMMYGSYEDHLKSLKVERYSCNYCGEQFDEDDLMWDEGYSERRCTECDYKIKTT